MSSPLLDRAASRSRRRGTAIGRAVGLALALVLMVALVELVCVAHEQPGPSAETPAAIAAPNVVAEPPTTWELGATEAGPSTLGPVVTR
jgi:hypothetical protein